MAKKPSGPVLTESELAALDMIILKAKEDGLEQNERAKFIHAVADVANKAVQAVAANPQAAGVGAVVGLNAALVARDLNALADAGVGVDEIAAALAAPEVVEATPIVAVAALAAERGQKLSANALKAVVGQFAGAPSVTLRDLIALRRRAVVASRKTPKAAKAKTAKPKAAPRKTTKRRG